MQLSRRVMFKNNRSGTLFADCQCNERSWLVNLMNYERTRIRSIPLMGMQAKHYLVRSLFTHSQAKMFIHPLCLISLLLVSNTCSAKKDV